MDTRTTARSIWMLVLAGACLIATTACTATSSASPQATDSSGIRPGYQAQTALEFTPLIVDPLAAQVVPIEGSDSQFWVVYELSVLNTSPRDATITRVETLSDDKSGAVLTSRDQNLVAANLMLLGGTVEGDAAEGGTKIPAGRTAIVVLRDTYSSKEAVPASFMHRISATFAAPDENSPRLAPLYPDEVAAIGGTLTVSDQTPLTIGSPVTGDNWYANNSLDTHALNAHSDVVIPVGGRVTGAERYGIDFLQMDPDALASFDGDPTQNASYLAFDEPLVAVADGTVVRVVSDLPDVAPRVLAELQNIDQAPGNQVVIDVGDDVFALYAHMKQDSATVAVGDSVKKGQEIGRLGNSGNTSEAHLHFQLQRGPLLSGENVPWVLDAFDLVGVMSDDQESLLPASAPTRRAAQFPVLGTVFSIPQ